MSCLGASGVASRAKYIGGGGLFFFGGGGAQGLLSFEGTNALEYTKLPDPRYMMHQAPFGVQRLKIDCAGGSTHQ